MWEKFAFYEVYRRSPLKVFRLFILSSKMKTKIFFFNQNPSHVFTLYLLPLFLAPIFIYAFFTFKRKQSNPKKNKIKSRQAVTSLRNNDLNWSYLQHLYYNPFPIFVAYSDIYYKHTYMYITHFRPFTMIVK